MVGFWHLVSAAVGVAPTRNLRPNGAMFPVAFAISPRPRSYIRNSPRGTLNDRRGKDEQGGGCIYLAAPPMDINGARKEGTSEHEIWRISST